MSPRQSDAEIDQIVQRSAAVRIVRRAFLALDAAAGSSALARAIPRFLGLRPTGLVLITASITHAGLISFVPAATAPAGRYLFAVIGLVTGGTLLIIDRVRR
jgi:hypothetical protein